MSKSTSVLLGSLAIGVAATMTYCSNHAKFIGTWTAINPVNITAQIPGASSASSLVTIDFIDNLQKKRRSGKSAKRYKRDPLY